MSTYPKADGVVAVHEELAEHIGDEFDATKKACITTLGALDRLGYLAHYSSSAFDFSVDVLGDPPRSADMLPGSTRRDELQRLGRTLSSATTSLDRTLQEVRTGALIRMVLHTEQGAAVCNSVVPREYVVGLVLNRAPGERGELLARAADVRATDMAMARLVSRLREQVSLPSGNPGGYETAEDMEASPPIEPSGDPYITFAGRSEAADGVRQACVRAIRPDDLHFVAYCRDRDVVFTADYLGDRSLARFFTQITVASRRKFYQEFSGELRSYATKLSRATSGVLGGLLLRCVLDVEQGAIYYYRIKPGDYLVGVTIDQSRVSGADDGMSRLANEAHNILGGLRSTAPGEG